MPNSAYRTFAVLLSVVPSANAFAGSADIDELSAKLKYGNPSYHLIVKYEVELDRHLAGADLVLYVTEDGHPLLNHNNQRMTFVLPLNRPTDISHSELEFEGRTSLSIPLSACTDPHDLRLHAEVRNSRYNGYLEHESTRIRYDAPDAIAVAGQYFDQGYANSYVVPSCNVSYNTVQSSNVSIGYNSGYNVGGTVYSGNTYYAPAPVYYSAPSYYGSKTCYRQPTTIVKKHYVHPAPVYKKKKTYISIGSGGYKHKSYRGYNKYHGPKKYYSSPRCKKKTVTRIRYKKR